MQLEQSADQFVQGTIPADVSDAGTVFGTLGLGLSSIVAGSPGTDVDNVTCQVLYDTAATVVAGTLATEANVVDVLTSDRNEPVTLNPFKCYVVGS